MDEDFAGCLAGNLRAAARVATRLYDAQLIGTGLRIGQVALLAQLHRQGPLTATQLARLLSVERSTAVREVQVLRRAGLVDPAPNPEDRRERRITLTGVGERRLAGAAPAWRQAQEQMRHAMGGESVAALVRLARLVVEEGESILVPE